ncbi:S8 family serine peptidase [Shewanella litorisediminis]|uniref:S8 family serine peptidase n=1 Tax=Shewanella litorisediminis TaxID=1173586 RepID=A0ABX7G0R8_9GAMM|nr:S8 family serine peptidase [Shewanella litorisediminis]QRH00896.1 S8 family serine peptidase [Shewanella litorisediminis]
MKLKKISIVTLAAMYAGAVGASAANSISTTSTGAKIKPIEVTENVKQFNKDKYKDRAITSGDSVKHSNGRNVHRAYTDENRKVAFEYEQGLQGEHVYIIELNEKPVTLYQGGKSGLQATSARSNGIPASLSPALHDKIDVNSRAVKAYRSYIQEQQASLISQINSQVGSTETVAQYQLAFNGIAIKMNQEQAAQVATLPNVVKVTREKMYELHTDVGPQHIGADKFWTGEIAGEVFTGKGIVVGVLDTGINSDHASFAAEGHDGYVHKLPSRYSGYLGDCEKEAFASMCNDKLIGVRSYPIITDTYTDPSFQPDKNSWEITVPVRPPNGEDYNGHGSHTASTVAGNILLNTFYTVPDAGVTSDGKPTDLVLPRISGVAPHANVIMYQVCHPGDGTLNQYAGCPGSALLAGVEDAIADGVDVINYSIGTAFGAFPWEDPVEMAFLGAREAGISVSASAGNSFDPSRSSQRRGAIDHLSPWLTSVAATTHSREFAVEGKMLTNSQGGNQPLSDIEGKGITQAYTGPVVEAKAYGWQYEKCNDPFPAGFFDVAPDGTPFDTAPIVVCKRGDIARVQKAINVAEGGAGGFILRNASNSESLNNDPFAIPGIHISYGDYYGNASNNYYGLNKWLANGSGHQLTITASEVVSKNREANYVADFSSRGHNFANPEVMSPNLAAPGVDVYAAWADDMPMTVGPTPSDFNTISGTSMAAPHVAGAMALLKQARPEWTPAQIQSALMTTASLDGVNRTSEVYPWEAAEPAGFSDAGSGVINVAKAYKAGLIMDETADNYRAANPKNGGTVSTLNVPYFFNESCNGTCTMMRTFTATADGSWTVDASVLAIDGADMLSLEVTPSSFSLTKGETQTILLTAKVLEVQAPGADSSSLRLLGDVKITPSAADMPIQHLPVSIRYSGNTMPENVSGKIHRKQGHILSPEIRTEEIQQFNYQANGLIKAERFDIQMKRSDARNYAGKEEREADGQLVKFFEVPEGTKRIVWEVIKADYNAYASIDIGLDVNNDGDIQWQEEAICYSRTDNNDFCAINNPTPGTYWAYASNYKYDYEDPENLADNFTLALAVIGEQDEGNLVATGPDTTNGMDPYRVQLNYDLADPQEGDIYYGYVGIGSDAYNAANLGYIPLQLIYEGADTAVTVSQTAAKVGDIVNFEVSLAPNLLGSERAFILDTVLDDGFQLLNDSISLAGPTQFKDDLTVDGNTISIHSVQESSLETKRHYVFTTSLDDATCRVPSKLTDNAEDTYFDLGTRDPRTALGIQGYSSQYLSIPMSTNGLPHVPLYGAEQDMLHDILEISPFGYVKFDELPDFYNIHREFTDSFQDFPDTIVAPLWRGDVMMPAPVFDITTRQYINNVYGAVIEDYYVFQWKGGKEFNNRFTGNRNPDPDSYFDVETIISTKIDFTPGQHEIMFGYKTIRSQNDHFGSIGLHGYYGERATFAPVNGWSNDGFAFNNVDEVVSDGMMICANYQGPESSGMTLSFSARVSAKAVGLENAVTVTSKYEDSETVTVSKVVKSPSNIQVTTIYDQSIEENTSLELTISYADLKNTVNGIMVEGEHISAKVDGDVVTITPDANWYGETQVTITVHDMAYPNDKASTSFTLTVVSDGVEPTPPPTPTPPASSDGGGSLGFLSLALLGLLGLGRRKY